jgi:hypothetical protein
MQAVAALVGLTQFIGSVSVHVRPSAGPAADELWEVRLSARTQYLLDDLDNFRRRRRLNYVGDLSELTFR